MRFSSLSQVWPDSILMTVSSLVIAGLEMAISRGLEFGSLFGLDPLTGPYKLGLSFYSLKKLCGLLCVVLCNGAPITTTRSTAPSSQQSSISIAINFNRF